MSLAKRLIAASGLVVAACLCLTIHPLNAKDEKERAAKSESQIKPGLRKTALKAFMRKKLALSHDIMEGLALEDFELIEKGAKQLKAMSVAAEFIVIDDPLYAEH